MSIIINYALSTIFVGVLEQCFFSFMALRILKAFDSLKVNKVKKALLIITPALLLNLPDIFKLDRVITLLFGIIVMIVTMYIVTKKSLLYITISITISVAIFLLTEGIFASLIMQAASIKSEFFYSHPMTAFLVSIPERIVQFGLIYFSGINDIKILFDPTHEKIDILTIIKSSRSYKIYTIIILVMTILYMAIFIKFFAVDGILHNTNMIFSIIISIILLCTPFVTMFIFVESLFRSHSVSKKYIKYIISNTEAKALSAYNKALILNDKETAKSISEILESLNIKDEN